MRVIKSIRPTYRSRNASRYMKLRKGMTRRSTLAINFLSVVLGGHSIAWSWKSYAGCAISGS
jgi:hypothetical protein